MVHLLQWQFQPDRRGRSWHATIVRERTNLSRIFKQSPTLERHAREDLPAIYPDAVRIAGAETGLPVQPFPPDCPYTFEQVAGHDYLPHS